MSETVRAFEADCTTAGLSPAAVLKEAGMNPSTWFRWKSGEVSPTLRSFEAAKAALHELSKGPVSVDDDGTLAPGASGGAENAEQNISRTAEVSA